MVLQDADAVVREPMLDEQRQRGFVQVVHVKPGYDIAGSTMAEARDQMTGLLLRASPEIGTKLASHGDDLEGLLQSGWEQAQAAWPALAVPLDAWMNAVASALDESSTLQSLRELHVADLFLAQACALGDPQAIAAFESTCRDAIEGSLRTLGLADDVIADVAQDVRHKLLVADQGPPKIASFSGRASLKTWTRTVATRTAVSRLRKKTEEAADDAVLDALPAVADGPDAQHFRAKYGTELKASFEEAMASLDPQQRNVLRHHYVDSLTIDEIGALYGVHKTTAFRWLEAARATLAKRTQNGFRARIRATPSEMQSIVRLLESNVELSLRRVLAS